MSKIIKRFSDYNLRSKLVVLIGIFLISLIILGSVVNLMFKSSQTMTILVNEDRVFVENFDLGIEHFYRFKITGNEAELNQSIEHFNKAIKIAYYFSTIDSILKFMPEEEWKPFLFDIYKEGVDFDMSKIELMASQIMLFSKINPKMLKEIQQVAFEASTLGNNIISNIHQHAESMTPENMKTFEAQFNVVHGLTERFARELYTLGDYLTKLLYSIIVILILLLGGIVTLTSLIISNSISRPINRLAENFKKIAKGNLKSSVKIDSDNEIGELSNAFFEIQVGLSDIISHAKKVAEGDYSSRLKPNSEEDELSPALNLMAAKLDETRIHSENESWLQNGISRLDDQMRGNYSVRELSERIITYLCGFLHVEMGSVYVYDEVLDHLELTGSMGIELEEMKKILKTGEGLIGQAAVQKSLQIINAKEKFHKLYSSVGEMAPEKLYLLPMHFDNRIQAVIELAPLNVLTELKIEFLKMVGERISVNISAAVARYRSKELLEETLEQAKNLKAQDEELKLKLEENLRIQEILSRETTLLNSMLSTLPDYVYFKDTNSKFLRISESMVSLFGAESSEEIIGKSDFDYHPEKDAKRYFKEEQEIIKKGEGFIDEIRQGVDENGDELWTSVTKLPMFNENGKCIGTFGISKEVTKIKKLEIEVVHQNERLKQQQEELQATNEELNAQEEELRVANEELAEQTKILTESEKSLQVQQEELRVANEELAAKTDLMELQKNEILEKNKKLTRTKKELNQKAKELELASQYKSEFLANMSHELRTPLNSMLILSKILADNKPKNLSDEQLKSVSIIHNSGKELLDLINEILDLSKIEAGKMNFDFSEIITDDVKNDIQVNFLPVAENKNLTLSILESEDFPLTIYSDRQRLMQIIKNLLSNAFKFTRTGGITVHFGIPDSVVEFNNPQLNNTNAFFIAVEDTGVGIPQGKVEAIFDAFQQADGSISRKFGGTGLGLSISKQLTQVLGGEIHVKSNEGVGSVFTVYLPLDKELVGSEYSENSKEEIQKENKLKTDKIIEDKKLEDELIPETDKIPVFVEDDRNSALNRIVVLIIHDEKEQAKMLIDLCHKKKFNALVAVNAKDALKLAELHTPQAIIISAGLNDEAEQSQLRKNKFTSNVPVHIVSRVDDSLFENIEELETPESKNLQKDSKNLENKIQKEFRQVLVVEDDIATRMGIQRLFENKDIIIHEAKTGKQAYEMISNQPFDCIILDLGLPDFSGSELLDKLNADKIPIPYVIVNTARELSAKELRKLQKYSDSIVIKGVKSDERLMDEVTLFLHQVSNTLPKKSYYFTNNNGDSHGFKGKKVLVVDDDIRNIFAIAQILEERGIEILEAENGEIALDVLKNNADIDLVLMDIMMPVMDGYDSMKMIRKTQGIENVPIITLTAKAMKEDYQKAIDCGANDFISKPVDIDKLLSLLKIWLFK